MKNRPTGRFFSYTISLSISTITSLQWAPRCFCSSLLSVAGSIGVPYWITTCLFLTHGRWSSNISFVPMIAIGTILHLLFVAILKVDVYKRQVQLALGDNTLCYSVASAEDSGGTCCNKIWNVILCGFRNIVAVSHELRVDFKTTNDRLSFFLLL